MNPFACCSASGGTVCGTRPVEAGEWNAAAAPPAAWSTTTCPHARVAGDEQRAHQRLDREVREVGADHHRAPREAVGDDAADEQRRDLRERPRRERARRPPTPSPPMSSTANATAIGTRFVPKNEIVRAPNSSRKFRCRSAFTGTRPSQRRLRHNPATSRDFPRSPCTSGVRHVSDTVTELAQTLRADLGLAQRVVERRLLVGRLGALADDQRAAELVRARRELLRARARDDDRARRARSRGARPAPARSRR